MANGKRGIFALFLVSIDVCPRMEVEEGGGVCVASLTIYGLGHKHKASIRVFMRVRVWAVVIFAKAITSSSYPS